MTSGGYTLEEYKAMHGHSTRSNVRTRCGMTEYWDGREESPCSPTCGDCVNKMLSTMAADDKIYWASKRSQP